MLHLQSMLVPGLVAAVVTPNAVTTNVYGWADVERRIPMTSDTVFQVGSITKTITATALMQAVEMNQVSLDQDGRDPGWTCAGERDRLLL